MAVVFLNFGQYDCWWSWVNSISYFQNEHTKSIFSLYIFEGEKSLHVVILSSYTHLSTIFHFFLSYSNLRGWWSNSVKIRLSSSFHPLLQRLIWRKQSHHLVKNLNHFSKKLNFAIPESREQARHSRERERGDKALAAEMWGKDKGTVAMVYSSVHPSRSHILIFSLRSNPGGSQPGWSVLCHGQSGRKNQRTFITSSSGWICWLCLFVRQKFVFT